MISDECTFPKILIVDDKAENVAILIALLDNIDSEFFVAIGGKEALKRIDSQSFDLVLLDIVMPDIDGYSVCEYIKNNPKTKDISVIFISASSGVEDKIKGFSYGADDYIVKPLVQEELVARVRLHLHNKMILKSLKKLLRKAYHELYNPLAIINTSLEMQNIKYGSSRYTDSIAVASKTLQLAYDDIYYSFSSTKQHELIVLIDLVKFMQSRIDFFSSLANTKNIFIDFISDEGNLIEMRGIDLLRIIDNTLSNAIKYANAGTVIELKISNHKNSVVFTCKNSGSMIKNPKKIFEDGYRENLEKIGMGIGLDIVASICHNYKIKPTVTSHDSITLFQYEIPKIYKSNV